MPPSPAQLTEVSRACQEYARLAGRSVLEVVQALLSTRTLREMGCTGALETAGQAEACIRIVNSWIRRTNEQGHQRG